MVNITLDEALEGEKKLKEYIDEYKRTAAEEIERIKQALKNCADSACTTEFMATSGRSPERTQEVLEELNSAKFNLSLDDFNAKLTDEQKEKLKKQTQTAMEFRKKMKDIDPCDDLGVCEVTSKHMALEQDGPEIQLLHFLIGKNNTQKLNALGYKLFRGNTDVELLNHASTKLSQKEQEMLKGLVKSFQSEEVDFDMLAKLLSKNEE